MRAFLLALLVLVGCAQNTMTTATLDTTKGTIVIELYTKQAPITTANFIKLSQEGFYNGVAFHRVIPGFMIQGGDPLSKNYNNPLIGTGGPGYEIDDEFSSQLKHDSAGILSMANSGPDTGGSQFFITLAPTPWLDGKHAVFGKVIKGQDVVSSIAAVKRNSQDKPLEAVVIKSVTIN